MNTSIYNINYANLAKFSVHFTYKLFPLKDQYKGGKQIPTKQNIHPVLIYCWPTVCDDDPTLNQHQLNVMSTLTLTAQDRL